MNRRRAARGHVGEIDDGAVDVVQGPVHDCRKRERRKTRRGAYTGGCLSRQEMMYKLSKNHRRTQVSHFVRVTEGHRGLQSARPELMASLRFEWAQ